MNRSRLLTSVSIFRWATTALVILIIVLFFKQNLSTFEQLQPFSLNLYVAETVKWSLKLYLLLIISAVIGFILGFGIMLKFYLNVRRSLAYERLAKEELEKPVPVETAEPSPGSTEPSNDVQPPPPTQQR